MTYDLFSENATSVVTIGNSVYFAKGKRLNRLGTEAGIGARTSYKDWDFSLNYDYGYRHNFWSHTFTAKAEYNF